MQIGALKTIISSQLGAALKMLENAVGSCSDELWNDSSLPKPFWYLAYHTLFFFDLYLSESPKGFKPPLPFSLSEMDPKGVMPERIYSRKELLEYLEYGRTKAKASIEALTEESALENCGFRWVGVSVAELFFYNARHVQHHAAQLNLLMRQKMSTAPKWVFKAE